MAVTSAYNLGYLWATEDSMVLIASVYGNHFTVQVSKLYRKLWFSI